MCSNRNIETRSRSFSNIEKNFQKDGIRSEVFSDNDILLWAEDKPDIVRVYWGADIPEIKKNTEIILNNQDDFRDKIDNTGTDVAELKNYVHNYLPTKADMERLLGDRYQQFDMNKERNTWMGEIRYYDSQGKRRLKKKRGFRTKKETLEWEETERGKIAPDADMLLEDFVEVYISDKKGYLKERTLKKSR